MWGSRERKLGRRQRNWAIIASVLVLLLLVRLTSTTSMPPAAYFGGQLPYVIAHQGGDALRPGNTMLAFKHAQALGADVLEMDVHATRDGVVVVMHDESVERTTNGSGLIREMTYADVAKLDAGYRWPYEGEEHPWRGRSVVVPTFDQVLTEFPEARFNVEIKQREPSIVSDVCMLLRRHAASRRTLVASFDDDTMTEFRQRCPEVATSAARNEVRTFVLLRMMRLMAFYQPHAHALQVPLDSPLGDLATPEVVAAAAHRGMFVDAWTVNDEATMQRLIDEKIGGIITDRPDVMLELLGRR